MKLITERMLIGQVAERFRRQYGARLDSPLYDGRVPRLMLAALESLDKETATAADVSLICGNDSWVQIKCDECGESVDAVIRVGQEPDYDSSTASLCFGCVRAAATIAGNHL